jgi:hypothetical protein
MAITIDLKTNTRDADDILWPRLQKQTRSKYHRQDPKLYAPITADLKPAFHQHRSSFPQPAR